MKAVLVYETMFGNTRSVAEAIGAGLALSIDTRCYEVSEAPLGFEDEVLLVVAGAPTHRLGLSTRRSRRDALKHADELISRIGMRDWMARLEHVTGRMVVAFDTQIAKPKLPGSATRAASSGA